MAATDATVAGGSYLEYITSVAGSLASYMRLPLLASSVSIFSVYGCSAADLCIQGIAAVLSSALYFKQK